MTAWEGTPANAQPHEHAAIRWFTLAEALDVELAHPAYRLSARAGLVRRERSSAHALTTLLPHLT